jgi:hypothetical protein
MRPTPRQSRMQGFPAMTSGFRVMRSSVGMCSPPL